MDGVAVYDLSRENSEMSVQLQDADGLATAPSASQIKGNIIIQRKITQQITGYSVDLAKECPEAVIEYFKNVHEPEIDKINGSSLEASGQHFEKQIDNNKANEDNITGDDPDCVDGSCVPELSANEINPIWKISQEEAKATAFENNEWLLILNCKSTCSNCSKVFANLQSDSFAAFCEANNIQPVKYYSDAKGNANLALYLPDLNSPGFILCRPLNGTGSSFIPDSDITDVNILQAWTVDTEEKLEAEINAILK